MDIEYDSAVVQITPNDLLRKLFIVPFTEVEKTFVVELIGSYGMIDNDALHALARNIQYFNPVHLGIIAGILINESYDVMFPLYPLQPNAQIDEIAKLWGEAVYDVILRTRIGDD
jgi:hypothetical protein